MLLMRVVLLGMLISQSPSISTNARNMPNEHTECTQSKQSEYVKHFTDWTSYCNELYSRKHTHKILRQKKRVNWDGKYFLSLYVILSAGVWTVIYGKWDGNSKKFSASSHEAQFYILYSISFHFTCWYVFKSSCSIEYGFGNRIYNPHELAERFCSARANG